MPNYFYTDPSKVLHPTLRWVFQQVGLPTEIITGKGYYGVYASHWPEMGSPTREMTDFERNSLRTMSASELAKLGPSWQIDRIAEGGDPGPVVGRTYAPDLRRTIDVRARAGESAGHAISRVASRHRR